MTKLMEEPLNVDQAARFLGLKKGTVYNMISRRVIPYHKLGRRVLFRPSELEAFFQSTLVACVPRNRSFSNPSEEKTVDMEAIIRNAIEDFVHR